MASKRVTEKLTEIKSYIPIPVEDLAKIASAPRILGYHVARAANISRHSNIVDNTLSEAYSSWSTVIVLSRDVNKFLGEKYNNKTLVILRLGTWDDGVILQEVEGLSIDAIIKRKKRARKILKTKRKQLKTIQEDIDSIINLFGDLEKEEE